MPLFLPPLSRREFLRRALLAGAAAAFSQSSLAALAERPPDLNTFVFLSDTHIAANPEEQHLGANMSHNLATCIGELNGLPGRPAAVMVNGDLAYLMGKPEDYVRFGTLIDPLRAIAPIHLSLGNHDDRQHFWTAFPGDAAGQHGQLHRQTGMVASEPANWFLLDSLKITDKTPGELGQPQLQWLARELDARPDKPAMIVVHHNPQFEPVISLGLTDTPALLAVIAPRRQVKMVVFGHTHNWHVATHESGIHLVNLPPTSYVFVPGCPTGWVIARLAEEGAQIELRAIYKKHPEHGQIHNLKWRRA